MSHNAISHLLNLVYNSFESLRIVYSEVCEHLTVNLDTALCKAPIKVE